MTMQARRHFFHSFCFLSGLLLLAGCSVIPAPQPDFTRYFVLTERGLGEGVVKERADGLRVGLKSVALPAYLDKGSIVVRRGENEVDYHDHARWAEPLAAGISRGLAAQLLTSPAVERVLVHPFPFDRERDCDIAVSIVRCEGVTGEGRPLARFAALVEITAADDAAKVLARRVFVAPDQPWDGTDHAALVRSLSEAVAALGSEIIGALPANGR